MIRGAVVDGVEAVADWFGYEESVASWLGTKPPSLKDKNFKNWAGNIQTEVDQIWVPENKEQLKWIVKEAYKRGKKVRAVGDGHSWSPMWFRGRAADGWIVRSDKFTQWAFDEDNKILTVGPGMKIGELMKVELKIGHCIPTQVLLTDVYIGGVIATGCHGTGWNRNTISDYVHSVGMIMWDGTEREITEADGDLFRAVQANMGAFGLMYEIKFKVIPQPVVHIKDLKPKIEEVLDRKNPKLLQDLVESHDYVEIFWFPLNTEKKLWVKTFKIDDSHPAKDGKCPRVQEIEGWLGSRLDYWYSFIERKVDPSKTPKISDEILAFLDTEETYQNLSYAMHFQPGLEQFPPILDVEMSIRVRPDFSNIVDAFLGIIEKAEAEAAKGHYPLNVNAELRFIANSQVLLSPSYGPEGSHHCWIEILSFDRTPGWEDFARDVLIPWMQDPERYDLVVPHMAKLWQILNDPKKNFYIEDYIRQIHGDRFNRFVKVRDEVDPHRMFLSPYLEDFFYPHDKPALLSPQDKLKELEKEEKKLQERLTRLKAAQDHIQKQIAIRTNAK
mmetsp:Transcript_5047/g.7104  ORF Transcript_5047/g.7104 Transcript_5047/m.7104 type:complete len:557 (+) Transcript_5047:45-1715(+)